MSEPKVLLWEHLRRSPIRFRRQHPAGAYIIDFYCAKAKLAVEVDGDQHAEDTARRHDDRRDAWLASKGVKTERVPTHQIWRDAAGVASEMIRLAVHRAEAPSTTARSRSGPPPPVPGEEV
jgi:very-short-patch-repair endonuclease